MSVTLVLAGVYNLAWGAWAVLLPESSFAWSGLEDPDKPLHYPRVWQALGFVLGCFGLLYLLAARDPVRNLAIVIVGFGAKLFGLVGMVGNVLSNQARPWALLMSIPNDLIWLVPFALILRRAGRTDRGAL
jgi:hypothetical protein